ncbi:MAG: protein kinase [Candidatus Nanopelagicales bacterium]
MTQDAGTPTRVGARSGDTLTNLRLASLPPISGFRLPYALRADYELVSMLPKRGSEALLLTVRPRGAEGPILVLKIYSRELGLRTDVLHLVQRAEVDHVVTLHDFGTEQGVGYEILEYVPAGDLDDLVDRIGVLTEKSARKAIDEITAAIECIHGLADVPLAHGDLKPANILVRTTEPLGLALADFGMATLRHDVRLSEVRGTPGWSDPRALTGYVQPEGDWWSLGAIAYWLRTGHELHHDLPEAAVADFLRERNADLSDLPADDEGDWTRLCQGLLARDEQQRWGASEVRRWLAGGSPDVGTQWAPPEPIVVAAPPAQTPIHFRGRNYQALNDFGLALAADWDDSAVLIDQRSDDLVAVLREHGRQIKNLDLTSDAESILNAAEPTGLRLSRLIRQLNPNAPPVYRQWAVDAESLGGLADRTAADPDSPEAEAVNCLFTDRVLTAWEDADTWDDTSLDARWHIEVDRWAQAFDAHAESADDALAVQARGAILLALLRPSEAERLSERARGAASKRARRSDWYAQIARGLGDGPGVDYAILSLAPAAERDVDRAHQAARDERNRSRSERYGNNLQRVPRTRRILGSILMLQAVLVALWLGLRVLAPHSWAGMTPDPALTLWARDLPDRLGNWLTWWTDPLIILPLFAASALLYWRARSDGPGGTAARHPLERRAMQAAIAVTCLLVPPLIPLGLLGWWRGLQFHSPAELRDRDPLRTVSMGSGLASSALLVGLVVGVGPAAESLVLTPEYQQWASSDSVVTAVAGPATSVGHLVGGIPATSTALVVTVLVCLLGPILVGLAARAYATSASAVRRGLLVSVCFGVVGLLNLPLSYLPSPWGVQFLGAAAAWLLWVVLRGRR